MAGEASGLLCPHVSAATTLLILSVAVPGLPQTTIHYSGAFHSGSAPLATVAATTSLARRWSLHAEGEAGPTPRFGEAFISAGDLEQNGWILHLGRQRISHGDERLLGASRDMPILTPGWDGVRLQGTRGPVSGELLSVRSGYYHASVHGIRTMVEISDRFAAEPYWLRKLQNGRTDVAGMRLTAKVGGFDYNVELAREAAGVWAGHWEIVPTATTRGIGVEFNTATPGFDELFPAALNKFGSEDPYSWSDTRNVALNYDRRLSEHLHSSYGYRAYWDATGRYQAQHAVAAVSWAHSDWQLTAGCGRVFQSRDPVQPPTWMPHVALTFRR